MVSLHIYSPQVQEAIDELSEDFLSGGFSWSPPGTPSWLTLGLGETVASSAQQRRGHNDVTSVLGNLGGLC